MAMKKKIKPTKKKTQKLTIDKILSMPLEKRLPLYKKVDEILSNTSIEKLDENTRDLCIIVMLAEINDLDRLADIKNYYKNCPNQTWRDK